MAVALRNRDGALELLKRFPAHGANPQEMTKRRLDDFITKPTQTFFHQFEIETKFRYQDHATWEQHEGFRKGLSIVREL